MRARRRREAKAQCLLPLLLLELEGEWRPIWVDWAARVTLRRLAEDVERALLLRAGHPLAWQRCKFEPQRAQDPIPPGARRVDPVIERDGYRCAVPGCTSRRNLHDHHIHFRSAGGSDAAENRITLCAFHHQRGVHTGLVRVFGHAPHELVFELGVRHGAAPLARYGSGDIEVPVPERSGCVEVAA